jgi:predicted peroxiredoxin
MNRLTAAIILAAIVTVGITACGADEPVRDGAFIHITHYSDDPHRLLMALNMASIMADDHDVLVYFDIKGVNAVLKDTEDITFSHFPSLKDQLTALKNKGIVLLACPGCLKAAGKSETDLAEGVQIADKTLFFSFTKGRILTLDY